MPDDNDIEVPDNVYHWFGQYFCGCGNPETAMAVLKDFFIATDGHEKRSDVITELEKKYTEGAVTLILYFLNGTNVLEHGGSVGGSWTTQLGKEIKDFLDANPDYLP